MSRISFRSVASAAISSVNKITHRGRIKLRTTAIGEEGTQIPLPRCRGTLCRYSGYQITLFTNAIGTFIISVTRKKSPNVHKSYTKMISLEK